MNRLSPPSHCRGRDTAFTVLELLIVVAVIAVLAGLLLPAISRARERARSVQCLNNVRQWTLAFQLYESVSDFIPRECGCRTDGRVRTDNWANVYAAGSSTVWYNCLPPLLKERPARYYATDETLRGEFYANRTFHCPSTKFPPTVQKELNAYFSLTMNAKLIQSPIRGPEASILYDSIQRPVDTVVFLESRVSLQELKVDPLQWDTELGQPSSSASRFAARHLGGGNLGFADGHVAWHSGNSVVEKRPERARGFAIFPDGKLLWSADPLIDPNGPD